MSTGTNNVMNDEHGFYDRHSIGFCLTITNLDPIYPTMTTCVHRTPMTTNMNTKCRLLFDDYQPRPFKPHHDHLRTQNIDDHHHDYRVQT